MGMFDDITYEAPCPICGKPLTRWQSKDGGCGLQNLTPAQLWEQSAETRAWRKEQALPHIFGEHAKFYTGCNGCGTNVEIRLEPGFFEYTGEEMLRIFKGERVDGRRGPVLPVIDPEETK
jgi:hypothetical protein